MLSEQEPPHTLPFYAGCGDTFDEGFLGEEEQDDDGEADEGAGRHEAGPVGAALGGPEGLQAER